MWLPRPDAKYTPRVARQVEEAKVKDILVSNEELCGQYLGEDLINEETGEVMFEAGDEITEELFEAFAEAKIKGFTTLAIDNINVGPYIRNTLAGRQESFTRRSADRHLSGDASG